MFFFFQAEDGIRDLYVTGVQTCALPIWGGSMGGEMKNKSGELNGFLDRGSSFRGELEFEDTMRIDGRFNGKIVTKNELIVGESAQIEGEVNAGRIAISGTIIGKIIATQRVE